LKLGAPGLGYRCSLRKEQSRRVEEAHVLDRNITLKHLDEEAPKLVLFCGKGGVGKTTCAAATAIHFAQKGLKTILISSDPAPSLSDILEIKCCDGVTAVGPVPSLHAVELGFDAVLEMWKERYGREVCQVISSFLPLGDEIMEYIAGAPGIDEEFMLAYVLDHFEGKDYEVVVWDTAPAGSTLYLLKLQEKFYKHLGEAGRLYLKIKDTLDKIKGKDVNPLKMLASWRELAQRVLDMMRSEKTRAEIVTIAEGLGVFQTQRVVREFTSFGVPLGKIIVNNVLVPESCSCDLHRERKAMQQGYIEMMQGQYGTDGLVILPLLAHEIKGIPALREIEAKLFGTRVSEEPVGNAKSKSQNVK
jgi:arsenite-transporting ATPase